MNDSQGINLNLGFWKNGYPEYIEDELCADVVDASSLRFNKTSHINILLENNLSLKEMKELNNYGASVAFQKVANDMNLPLLQNIFGAIGRSSFGQKIENEDANIYISDLLKCTNEPVVIYSSGANDLMYLANANPSSLKKYDSDGNITEKYKYAKSILCNSDTINKAISGVEQNFYNILSINPSAKIFALSIYVPNSLNSDDYECFVEAIENYNEELKLLCEKYNVCFIDETELGKVYNEDNLNFHINEIGHKKLASIIIDKISENICNNSQNIYDENYLYKTNGLSGYYHGLVQEITNVEKPDKNEFVIYPYLNDVYLAHLNEKIKDAETCKTLIKK